MGEKQKPCSHDPRQYAGEPIGMYHCPECGHMVLAGMEHLDWSILDDDDQQPPADKSG